MTTQLRRLCLAGLLLPLVACVAKDDAGSIPPSRLDSSQAKYVAGEYIVTTEPNLDVKTISRVYAKFGIKKIQELGNDRYLLRLSSDPGLERVHATGVESGKIRSAQRNFVYRTR